MTYKNFLDILEENNLNLKTMAEYLGYNKDSIINNWPKNHLLPEKVVKAINLYLEVSKLKQENEWLKKQLAENNERLKKIDTNLNDEALEIAIKKCKDNNISLKQYLSSLVISNI